MFLRLFFISLFCVLLSISACTNRQPVNANRVYFCIDTLNRRIIIPVQINDSVAGYFLFDTGAADLTIDSSFFADNNLLPDIVPQKRLMNFPAYQVFDIPSLQYQTVFPVIIGETTVTFDKVKVHTFVKSAINEHLDGIFSIPHEDTTVVWELNFEENYLEVHSADNFQIPAGSILLPIIEVDNHVQKYNIQMPMTIVYNDDTLNSNYIYMIDTGNTYMDMLLTPPAAEIDLFEKRGHHRVYNYYNGGVFWEDIVKATVFDSLTIDTLKIYTYSSLHNERMLGINFLERFNVFFDIKNKQLGLQPIHYERIEDILKGTIYYFVDTTPTSRGTYKIIYIPNIKNNYYKTAGLSVGDEIISWNGYPYGDVVTGKINVRDIANTSDTLVYDIIRSGKLMKILVPVPK